MQCTNYLKATGLQLCLLRNFGKPRLEIKRVAHGISTAPNHLRVLRASPFCICAKLFLDPQRRKAGNISQDCTRSQRARPRPNMLNRSEFL